MFPMCVISIKGKTCTKFTSYLIGKTECYILNEQSTLLYMITFPQVQTIIIIYIYIILYIHLFTCVT